MSGRSSSGFQSTPSGDEFIRDIDRIVITTLKNAGYAIEWEDKSLRNYNFEEIVNMVIFCLRIIFPERNFPESLPFGMQNRYRLSTQFTDAVQSLNYTCEIGYHTFMYNNKEPIRNVLVFLTDQLSRTDGSTFKQNEMSKKQNIKQRMKEELKKSLSKTNKNCHLGITTTPFVSLPLETGIILPAQKIDCKPIEWKEFVSQKLPYIDDQLSDDRGFLPSVVALNATGLHFPKRMKKTNLSFSPLDKNFFKLFADFPKSNENSLLRILSSTQDKEYQSARDFDNAENIVELSETEKAVIEVENEVNVIKPRVEMMYNNLQKAKEATEKLQKMLTEKRSQQSTLEHSLSLLPNAEENKKKLEDLIRKNKEKIASLQLQTNDHKQSMLKKLAALQKIEDEKIAKKNRLSEYISQLRSGVFNVVEQIKQREIVLKELESRSQSIQGEDRNIHVERIFKFIENLKKQEAEILDIISDMREVQKAINVESEKADRGFIVTSQLLKDHVSNDNFSAKSYQLLLTVHKLISDIIQLDTERVNQEKAAAQLEYELLNHESSPLTDTFKDITSDLRNLKTEVDETEIIIEKKEKELKRLIEAHKRRLFHV